MLKSHYHVDREKERKSPCTTGSSDSTYCDVTSVHSFELHKRIRNYETGVPSQHLSQEMRK